MWRATLPDSDVPVYLVEQAEYYERDDPAQGLGLYQYSLPDGKRSDYADNCERFVFFCRAVMEAPRLLGFWPNVIHANDWQTGLVPVYLQQEYRWKPGYKNVRALFTIHNIAYQGRFWHLDMPLTGLPWWLFNHRQLEFYAQLNFLKAGIVFADLINTVSPTYAKEIMTPYYGCGLQGVLTERRDRLFGIVNGVDYRDWDPATDRHLPAHYNVSSVTEGKPLCKAALQKEFGLPERPRVPLIGVIARLVEQKGIDLILKAADGILHQDAQLVVLGEGDLAYHRQLEQLRNRWPDRVGLYLGFDEALAHRIEAGADLFLMPSLYEPSGLNQLYSMRYGTPPVVRSTGGLADTVVDYTPDTLQRGVATGFVFAPYYADVLAATLQRAFGLYHSNHDDWYRLVRTGMQQDWSWERSAAEYEKLYAKARSM